MSDIVRSAQEALVLAKQYARAKRKGSLKKWRPPSGKAIKRMRQKLGLSQKAFAMRFGVTVYKLRKWEAV